MKLLPLLIGVIAMMGCSAKAEDKKPSDDELVVKAERELLAKRGEIFAEFEKEHRDQVEGFSIRFERLRSRPK